jgi:hypothetical protein
MYTILIDADGPFLEITIDEHMHVIEYRDMITACYHAAMIEDIEKRYRT